MLLSLIRQGFNLVTFIALIFQIPLILFSLSFHEAAHGFVAYKLGDPTPKYAGRLTLNPFKHLDLYGSICMLLVGIGWAKPVPVNANNFSDRKKGMALTAAAGPLSNLLLAFISELLVRITSSAFGYFDMSSIGGFIGLILYYIFSVSAYLNVYLAVFNLIPIPPFDGSRLLLVFLPERTYFGIMRYERYIKIIVLVLMFSSALSGVLSSISDFILNIFDYVIGLVPFL